MSKNTDNVEALEKEFHVSTYIIAYKFLLGVAELLLGSGMLIWGNQIAHLYDSFRSGELLEDPNDTVANLLQKVMPYLLAHRGYIILLLVLLGIVKIVGSIGLYYKKYWGYDLLIGLTIVLLPFDLFNFVKNINLYNFSFFILNLLIALYLVEFKPHHYFRSVSRRLPFIRK